MEEGKHIVILAAGDAPRHAEPLRALREADFVVCCDSAYQTLMEIGHSGANYVVIGDGDSLPDAEKKRLGSRWIVVEEQDYNDLHKAMQWAIGRYPEPHNRFTIVGATGRREDHTLGNISYLATFADEYPSVSIEMLTDYGSFVYCKGSHTLPSFAGQQVSIFTLTPHIPISLSGLQWPADGLLLRRWWQATLNTALGSQFTVDGGELLIFRSYDPK